MTTAAPDAATGRVTLTALTALAPAVWGTTYVVTTELLPPGHPLFAALVRALPAGLAALLLTRVVPRGPWLWKAAVLGTLNIGAFFPLLFVAAERLPGGVAATLAATQPIVVALAAVGVLGERLSGGRTGWGAVGVAGVALVVLGPDAAMDPLGIAAGIGGAVTMALGVTLTKRWGRPDGVSAPAFAGWQLTAGGCVLLVPTLLIDGVPARVDGAALSGYAWLGIVGGLLAYTLWFNGLRSLPVTATALLTLLSPLVAAAFGALLLGEGLGVVQLVGFALALTAMVGGQLAPAERPRTQRPPAGSSRPGPSEPDPGGPDTDTTDTDTTDTGPPDGPSPDGPSTADTALRGSP
ncbi:putative blue pigment (indigoidine) exporter [Prauserella isguenensis]|uniref:Putative blue pigment (Indigoidine) exporter n=1 Tax=Prauserella isguenensis TaxID=1470180 RepID=A0A839RTJ4_9PSEU|nr:putative blue pigment (indigoidine) exporter [Prauserella isguenensis]